MLQLLAVLVQLTLAQLASQGGKSARDMSADDATEGAPGGKPEAVVSPDADFK